MDASQDVWDWDWEVLPDHRSSSTSHGSKNLDDEETEEHDQLPPSGDDDVDVHDEDECKDIGVVPDETKSVVPSVTDDPMASDDGGKEEKKQSSVADLMASDAGGEEEKTAFQSPDAKDATAAADDNDDGKFAQEEEEDTKKEEVDDDKARPQCLVFSVGKLKVNGIGALCSFGVAAATVCVFLIGGRMQQHHHHQHRQQEQQKIQLQFYGDDKRIQQVVQQTSRLNQAMSSVMGAGGGASTRANVSFGGFYDGF